MKKRFRIPLFLLIATLLLTLCGCSQFEQPTGPISGTTFTNYGTSIVDFRLSPQAMKLDYNRHTYSYGISQSGESITYTIYYPNGGSYYETRGGDTETSGWNESYNIGTKYTGGEELVEFLSHYYYISQSSSPTVANILIALLCLAIGCFNLFLPEAAWHWAHMFRSWQYESIEPSDAGITWTRVGGIVILIMGVIAFFSNWS